MNNPRRYYVDLEDGFVEGDIYLHKEKIYEVIRIEAFNQLMEVQEIEDELQRETKRNHN